MKRGGVFKVLLGVLVIGLATGRPARAASGGRVSGGGHFTGLFGLEYVTVNAVQKADGSVSGQFEVHGTLSPGVDSLHAAVTCLDFLDDHTAVVSGVITDVHNLPPALSFIQPGSPFATLVQDNSSGQSGAPDVTGPFLTDDPSVTFSCGDPGLLPYLVPYLVPLDNGNFQVSR